MTQLNDQDRADIKAAFEQGFIPRDRDHTVKPFQHYLESEANHFWAKHGRYPSSDEELADTYRRAQAQTILEGVELYRRRKESTD